MSSPLAQAPPAPAGQDGALPDSLPVLPLKDNVVFPDTLAPLAVGQERSIRLLNDVLGGNRMLVMAAARDPELDEPSPDQVHAVGVAGVVQRMIKVPDGTLRILVQGIQRVGLGDYASTDPYLVARVEPLPDIVEESPELEALVRNVRTSFGQIIQQGQYLPEELQLAVANVESPIELSHMIAGSLRIKTEEKQELLEERNVAKRLRRLADCSPASST